MAASTPIRSAVTAIMTVAVCAADSVFTIAAEDDGKPRRVTLSRFAQAAAIFPPLAIRSTCPTLDPHPNLSVFQEVLDGLVSACALLYWQTKNYAPFNSKEVVDEEPRKEPHDDDRCCRPRPGDAGRCAGVGQG
ncbi:exported hypothetical protein [Nitrospira lenta]|uniref:Uncharacterized protein n=1 Tax=Nitrospira lenta TaxID=1436998 RepID=A0A330L0T9_9BACT|nr:exported hypothetical protein [Nitrospira lenta]